MTAPQTAQMQQFGYTIPTLALAVEPGTWEWQPLISRAVQGFASFDPGNGPSTADFTCDVLVNGAAAFTITVTNGDDEDIVTVSPAFVLHRGDLVNFQVTQLGTATGPAEVGFGYF